MHERTTLRSIVLQLSDLFSKVPDEWDGASYADHYRNLIFPYIHGRLKADERWIPNATLKLVSTSSLYNIFERC
jgi:hypothetical protein